MTDQPTLFETPADARWFYLTNRFNLLEILASGFVAPIQAYDKYYEDLLARVPGYVPLLSAPPSSMLIDVVTAESPLAYPVVLELTDVDVTSVEAVVGEDGGQVAVLAQRAIRLSSTTTTHFRSVVERDEHEARTYDNVRAQQPYAVSPELFWTGGGADVLSLLSTATTDTAEDRGEKLGQALGAADRWTGAAALIAAMLDREPAVALTAVEAFASVLPSGYAREGAPPWLGGGIRAETRKPRAVHPAGRALFDAALLVFSSSDRSVQWRASDVLERIAAHASSRVERDGRDEISTNVKAIMEIVRGARPFDEFKPTGLVAAKGLLLAMLAPTPDRLMSWPLDDVNATWEAKFVAAALVGALAGRRKLPVGYRRPAIDDFLADQVVLESAEAAGAMAPKRRPRVQVVANEARATVRVGGRALAAWEIAASTGAITAEEGQAQGAAEPYAAAVEEPGSIREPAEPERETEPSDSAGEHTRARRERVLTADPERVLRWSLEHARHLVVVTATADETAAVRHLDEFKLSLDQQRLIDHLATAPADDPALMSLETDLAAGSDSSPAR